VDARSLITIERRPFEGDLVRVELDGAWSYYRCCWCRRPLRDEQSRRQGYGPHCAKLQTIEEHERRLAEAKALDRAAYRRHREIEAIRAKVAASGRYPDDGSWVDGSGRVRRGWML
jgi:hypothetical protein